MQKKSRWREYFFHQFIYSDTTHFIHIYSWRSVTGSILRGLSRRLMVRILTGKTLLLMVKQCAWLVKASRMVATLLEMAWSAHHKSFQVSEHLQKSHLVIPKTTPVPRSYKCYKCGETSEGAATQAWGKEVGAATWAWGKGTGDATWEISEGARAATTTCGMGAGAWSVGAGSTAGARGKAERARSPAAGAKGACARTWILQQCSFGQSLNFYLSNIDLTRFNVTWMQEQLSSFLDLIGLQKGLRRWIDDICRKQRQILHAYC